MKRRNQMKGSKQTNNKIPIKETIYFQKKQIPVEGMISYQIKRFSVKRKNFCQIKQFPVKGNNFMFKKLISCETK
jgi:hypothetical protein